MRPTRWGWVTLLMTALALASAGASGNNLLFLLYGALASAVLISAVAAALTCSRIIVEALPSAPAARETEFPLHLRVSNPCPWPCWGLRISWGSYRVGLPWIEARGSVEAVLRLRLPHRGLNRLEGLRLSGTFPFNLWTRSRALSLEPLLAWPQSPPARDLTELAAQVGCDGRPAPRKGGGGELYGLREFAPGDDARLIQWKMTAKLGRPIVAEYGSWQSPRLVVSLPPDCNDERLIEDAAAACGLILDSGAEAALEAGAIRVDFGRGRPHLEKMLGVLALLGAGGAPRPALASAEKRAPDSFELASMRGMALMTAAVVFSAVWLIDESSARLAWLGFPVLALGLWTQKSGRPLVPTVLWGTLSLGILIWTTGFDWRFNGVAIANIHLLLYLLAYRIIEPIGKQDVGQALLILFLGFFLSSGLTISLWYFAAFLSFMVLAYFWLALAAGAPIKRLPSAWRAGLAAGALGLGAAAGFFMLTPRGEGLRRISPYLAAGIDKLSIRPSAVMGFTDGVTLGWFGELKRSSARAMRVKPAGGASGRPPVYYVRGAAFDIFDGHKWSSSGGRTQVAHRGRQLLFPIPAPRRSSPVVEFNIYPMTQTVLFTVETPWLIDGADESAWIDGNDSIRLAASYLNGLHYRAYFNPAEKGFGARTPGYEVLAQKKYLRTPPDPGGKTAALARRAAAGAATPKAKIFAVQNYLKAHFSYSNYSSSQYRGLDDFLFVSHKGNCEFFASAEAVLLRHLGIATRLTTGFLADSWNEYGQFFDVRQSDAHAWVEAYLPGHGWVSIDPTPAQGLFSASADAFSQKLARWFEAAQTQWYRNIIGYDQDTQNDTFKRLTGAFSTESIFAGIRLVARPMLWVGALLVSILGLRRLIGRFLKRPAGLFAKAQIVLERRGFRRVPSWTAREYAREVSSRRPDLAMVGDLAELHYQADFSGRGLTGEEKNRAAKLLRDLRSRL